jgi:transposase
VPVLIVPDQASGLVTRPDRYEPKLNRLVEEFSEHYSVTVLPARPAHPKDKPKVEVAVQIVGRWIQAQSKHARVNIDYHVELDSHSYSTQ